MNARERIVRDQQIKDDWNNRVYRTKTALAAKYGLQLQTILQILDGDRVYPISTYKENKIRGLNHKIEPLVEKIKEDFEKGMSISGISRKYKIAWTTVKNITKNMMRVSSIFTKRRKITPEIEKDIILNYKSKTYSVIELAKKYAISREAVYLVIRKHKP